MRIPANKIYFFPDYSADKQKLERVPDHRLQLYWNPDVSVTNDRGTALEFYTSDVVGDFEIVIEGFLGDGRLITMREVFSVVK